MLPIPFAPHYYLRGTRVYSRKWGRLRRLRYWRENGRYPRVTLRIRGRRVDAYVNEIVAATHGEMEPRWEWFAEPCADCGWMIPAGRGVCGEHDNPSCYRRRAA